MILALDLGNSRTKWGLFKDSVLIAHGVFNETQPTPDALCDVTRVLACSVVAKPTEDTILKTLYAAGLAPTVPYERIVSSANAAGVVNGYEEPNTLGADRFAALVAARARETRSALVVMAGTATTIDALDQRGQFLGGFILPGLDLMAHSLTQHTHQIASARGHHQPFPKNTSDAVWSGAVEASVGAIYRQYQRLQESTSDTPRLILTGGHASSLLPVLIATGIELQQADTLVLEGIARLA